MVDRWLGRFLELARSLGMLEDTLLIVTSDHGHQLGEHGLTGKVSRGMWYELMDVPLFVRSPDGQLAGRRADAFAQHQDIVPTVLATLDVEPPASLDGVDLIRLAKGQVPPRGYVVSGFNNYVWYRDERWAYIGRNDGKNTLLFDIEEDPLQENDLSEEERGVAERIHQGVVEEAGGPLPVYADVLAQIDVSWYRV
jgi:arylsulfatase A-like enzyme